VDLVAETMTDTQARRDSVDFSITFFVTGAQFLTRKGSAIKGIEGIGGKRIAAQQGSTNAKIIRERAPTAKLVEFPDQPAAFQALAQRQVEAYTNDGIQLAGLRAKAPKPDDWTVVGEFFSYEPYGMALRKNDSDFRQVVNVGLMDAIASGLYFKLYDKWFGPKGEVPYPLSAETKRFLQMQVVPK
ncbi:MAG TPA: transporter substrate-binding domain-containing protein, partial [Candidatus Eisenbacteria bacterium]|nr:transporter substrate-binding domain-containing protein [Candidatus Eisenbacteria bacterium]